VSGNYHKHYPSGHTNGMLGRMKTRQHGSALVVLMCILVVAIGGVLTWVFLNTVMRPAAETKQVTTTTPVPVEKTPLPATPKEPDSADTLSSPVKVPSADGNTYFMYGAPKGQNNTRTKHIIISLPGHGTKADDGYKAWKGHLEDGHYALAEFNWWRGTGETTGDYYSPAEIVKQTRAFLAQQHYTSKDIVVLHGFSRGSANTYAVIAQDRIAPGHVFDAVISNAGKYQAGFPLATPAPTDAQITQFYTAIPWVLVCGGRDENPLRDGCPGMTETKQFLEGHGANVLALLSDPAMGHGAFHLSPLKLPKQALARIDSAVQ